MTPTACNGTMATTSTAVAPKGGLEVAQFSSALTYNHNTTNGAHQQPQWLITSGSQTFELPLPDGTTLGIMVKVADVNNAEVQQSNKGYNITINAWISRMLIKDAATAQLKTTPSSTSKTEPLDGQLRTDAFPITMHCRPPKPRYKSSSEEPDDNSFAQRTTRYACAQLDLDRITSQWTAQEKATLAWVQLYVIVNMLPTEEAFNVALASTNATRDLIDTLLDSNLAILHPVSNKTVDKKDSFTTLVCLRSTFWQSAFPFSQPPWLHAFGRNDAATSSLNASTPFPSLPIMSAGGTNAAAWHPRRPRKPHFTDGPVYSRYILELGQTLTFEPTSSKDDGFVRLFTKWHNQERVAQGWRQRGTEAEQRRYLESVERSDDTLSLVGKWNGEPWGYVEIYWAKESNVGAFYEAGAYDRGFHAFVGEERFRGPHRVRTWMGSVLHMLFTLDVRTQRVILEPRASNEKMIAYTTMCGGHVEKLIDLPHKRAALVICPRERFFQLCPLAPLGSIVGQGTSASANGSSGYDNNKNNINGSATQPPPPPPSS